MPTRPAACGPTAGIIAEGARCRRGFSSTPVADRWHADGARYLTFVAGVRDVQTVATRASTHVVSGLAHPPQSRARTIRCPRRSCPRAARRRADRSRWRWSAGQHAAPASSSPSRAATTNTKSASHSPAGRATDSHVGAAFTRPTVGYVRRRHAEQARGRERDRRADRARRRACRLFAVPWRRSPLALTLRSLAAVVAASYLWSSQHAVVASRPPLSMLAAPCSPTCCPVPARETRGARRDVRRVRAAWKRVAQMRASGQRFTLEGETAR